MYHFTEYKSPVGLLCIAASENKIVRLWIEGQKYFRDTVSEKLVRDDSLPVLHSAKKWLDAYFGGIPAPVCDLPLAPIGGEFRQTVWKILTEIPYGHTTTYGDIAKETARRLGKNVMSAQAIGGAVGHNPISIIIPCHRVIGANGKLTGYAGGIEKKAILLQHEAIELQSTKFC